MRNDVNEVGRLGLNDELRARTRNLRGRVLDVGSGPRLRHRNLLPDGIEHLGIDLVDGSSDGSYVRMDATQMGFRDGVFDAVICLETLEHVDDPQAAVTEIARVLRDGGRVVVSVPTVWTWPFQLGRHGPHYFSARHLRALLETHFVDIDLVSVGGPFTWFIQLVKNWLVLVTILLASDRQVYWRRVDALSAPFMRAAHRADRWLPRLLPVHYVAAGHR